MYPSGLLWLGLGLGAAAGLGLGCWFCGRRCAREAAAGPPPDSGGEAPRGAPTARPAVVQSGSADLHVASGRRSAVAPE